MGILRHKAAVLSALLRLRMQCFRTLLRHSHSHSSDSTVRVVWLALHGHSTSKVISTAMFGAEEQSSASQLYRQPAFSTTVAIVNLVVCTYYSNACSRTGDDGIDAGGSIGTDRVSLYGRRSVLWQYITRSHSAGLFELKGCSIETCVSFTRAWWSVSVRVSEREVCGLSPLYLLFRVEHCDVHFVVALEAPGAV
jgi:hypothetical protein